MGWALTYFVKFGRPLEAAEKAAFEDWIREHGPLDPVDPKWVEGWRGVLSDEELQRHRSTYQRQKVDFLSLPTAIKDADYAGFMQTRSMGTYKATVTAFQKLEALLPFAIVRISDDYYSRNARPSEIDLNRLVAGVVYGTEEREQGPAAPAEVSAPEEPAPELSDAERKELEDVERTLEKARADFARWKNRGG